MRLKFFLPLLLLIALAGSCNTANAAAVTGTVNNGHDKKEKSFSRKKIKWIHAKAYSGAKEKTKKRRIQSEDVWGALFTIVLIGAGIAEAAATMGAKEALLAALGAIAGILVVTLLLCLLLRGLFEDSGCMNFFWMGGR